MKILLVACLMALCFTSVRAALGIDVSQLFSVENYTCVKNSGVSFAVARAFRSYGAVDPNAVQSLTNMKQAGLHTDLYMFPCRGKEVDSQVTQLINAIPANLYQYIWIDIETNSSPGCSWNDHDSASNCKYTMDLVQAIRSKGKKVGIYASHYMWGQIYSSYTACPQAATGTPLWYAHYDYKMTFDDFVAFGGWTKPDIKQYQGTNTLCGASVDRNWRPG